MSGFEIGTTGMVVSGLVLGALTAACAYAWFHFGNEATLAYLTGLAMRCF